MHIGPRIVRRRSGGREQRLAAHRGCKGQFETSSEFATSGRISLGAHNGLKRTFRLVEFLVRVRGGAKWSLIATPCTNTEVLKLRRGGGTRRAKGHFAA